MDSRENLNIKGKHMLNNMFFVLVVSEILNLSLNKTIDTIKNSKPLSHRMEYIGTFNDVLYYDNSIATIPIATIDCIEALENVNTLICGGMDRGVSQKELIDFLKTTNVKNIICMPGTGFIIYESLKNLKNTFKAKDMEEAVDIAKVVTEKNTICLLSPAASSYNEFKNFEEKGNIYKKLVTGNII